MTKSSYFSREPTIRTEAQMREILAVRTRAKVEPEESGELSTLPPAESQPAAPTVLAWMPAVIHGDGTGFQTEMSGKYSVVREIDTAKAPQAFVYRLFDRTTGQLLSSHGTAQEAREAVCAL